MKLKETKEKGSYLTMNDKRLKIYQKRDRQDIKKAKRQDKRNRKERQKLNERKKKVKK